VGRFQLDKDQRQAVDEPDQVAAALVDFARDPPLGGQEEIVVGRRGPVDHRHPREALDALTVAVGEGHAVFEQGVDLAVGFGGGNQAAVAGQLGGGLLQRDGGQAGVEFLQGGRKTGLKDDLVGRLAAEAPVLPKVSSKLITVDLYPIWNRQLQRWIMGRYTVRMVLYRYTAPAEVAELSAWSPLTPVALLDSEIAPATKVLLEADTE